jgi:hypothetical protein
MKEAVEREFDLQFVHSEEIEDKRPTTEINQEEIKTRINENNGTAGKQEN